jgi:hypothetical protein
VHIESLEDESELLISQIGELILAQAVDTNAIEVVAAFGRNVEASEDVHERRFAGARRSHDGDHLACIDCQIDPTQREHFVRAHRVDLLDVRSMNDCFRRHGDLLAMND